MKTRRIFVSLPADDWLTDAENATKWGIVARIEALGYTTEIFTDPRGARSVAASQAWSATECENVMRRCDGCVLLGFARWRLHDGARPLWLATDFNHYEGALAHTLGLPLLALVQDGVQRRVVFDASFKGYVGTIPQQPGPDWLDGQGFEVPFGYWRERLAARCDVFLGYCSSAAAPAAAIKAHLVAGLGLRVLDWAEDFDPATSILQQIQQASQRCGAGIFLFTKDDLLSGKGGKGHAAPRDNVVFEAGFFSAHKGKSRVLVVLEQGAKLPADLGGDIYAALVDKTDIGPIEPVLRRFALAL
ncbi:nucleotide-binding protein [Aquabacterium sp. OR-4]|uniref:nucleotide-binding protein n=1 Tax=Aquabacterium sp. OR-4 TaxID=2978127 RepID=UPI0021B27458|nr:nucleotide-binding protein [Aquabacterium sp. OR-4]MDT7833638.1 nucleotide-binding protein [Aquabacterium sp. OR-4]